MVLEVQRNRFFLQLPSILDVDQSPYNSVHCRMTGESYLILFTICSTRGQAISEPIQPRSITTATITKRPTENTRKRTHTYPQEASFLDTKFPYEFRLFRGDVIKLHGNWVYSINGQTCSTEAYSGVDSC